jgi:transposase InsO family protein
VIAASGARINRVCRLLKVSRATLYRHRRPAVVHERRGPKPEVTDSDLAERIRDILAERERVHGFRGEGHRKVYACLRFEGVPVARRRVLRVMREHGLLAPMRAGRRRGPYVHDGVLVTERPDVMWGTDATMAYTTREGWAWVFAAVDHCTSECIGIHAAKPGTRFEALEPLRQGIRDRFGPLEEGVATGLKVRHDHGSQYISDYFQDELRFLGIESSPSFIGAPEGNGIAERFNRTLKEQLLWVRIFETVEELRRELLAFRDRYNEHWMLERHAYASPAEARRRYESPALAAA